MRHRDIAPYPRLVRGRWVFSPLGHAKIYADRADRDGETHVAVPAWLLARIGDFRECGKRRTFNSDEDGPMPPMEVACRREQGHDDRRNPDHVRSHSNGYYTWLTDSGASL